MIAKLQRSAIPVVPLAALLAAACAVVPLLGMVGLLIVAVLAIALLAVRAPAYSFLAVILLFGFEGTIKMRLTVEGASSPLVLGATAIDLALVISVIGLLASDRGATLRSLWRRFGLAERLVALAIGAWIVLALLQIPLTDSAWQAAKGIRLEHFYVIALPVGAIVAAKLRSSRLQQALLVVIGAIAAYAAFRGIVGPAANERRFNASRDANTLFLDHARDAGSFTSPVALVSFLVPAAVFAFALACVAAARRVPATFVFALAMIGIVASMVRTALVAVAGGALALAVLLVGARGVSTRLKLISVGLVVAVLAAGYGSAQLAGNVNWLAKGRAESLLHPFSDYSVTMRVKKWHRALDQLVDEPFGSGPGTIGRATNKHGHAPTDTDSSYLKVLREQGFPGGFLFLFGVLGATVLCALRLMRSAGGPLERPLGVAALAGFVGFLLLCVMGEYIEQPGKALAWTLLGIASWEAYGRGAAP
jgi:hypothetical protein